MYKADPVPPNYIQLEPSSTAQRACCYSKIACIVAVALVIIGILAACQVAGLESLRDSQGYFLMGGFIISLGSFIGCCRSDCERVKFAPTTAHQARIRQIVEKANTSAELYLTGIDADKNDDRALAIACLEKAVAQGDGKAAAYLGNMHRYFEEYIAMKYWRQGAALKNQECIEQLALYSRPRPLC